MLPRPMSILGYVLIAIAFPLVLSAAVTSSPSIKAPQVDTLTHVLFLGNSYLYYGDSLHNHVRRMEIAGDSSLEKKMKYKSATIGGAALAHHNIDRLIKPGQIGVKEPF